MNYCKYLRKRKSKPYCYIIRKEISFSTCQECDNKEYKKSDYKCKRPKAQKKTKMHNKSKKLTKLERNRYSVFSNDTKKCYLCDSKYKLTWHEIYSGRNRQNSMKYGLCLRMCLNCHSREQENSQFNDYWHRQGQLYWEEFFGSREEFIKVFRRNYLD